LFKYQINFPKVFNLISAICFPLSTFTLVRRVARTCVNHKIGGSNKHTDNHLWPTNRLITSQGTKKSNCRRALIKKCKFAPGERCTRRRCWQHPKNYTHCEKASASRRSLGPVGAHTHTHTWNLGVRAAVMRSGAGAFNIYICCQILWDVLIKLATLEHGDYRRAPAATAASRGGVWESRREKRERERDQH